MKVSKPKNITSYTTKSTLQKKYTLCAVVSYLAELGVKDNDDIIAVCQTLTNKDKLRGIKRSITCFSKKFDEFCEEQENKNINQETYPVHANAVNEETDISIGDVINEEVHVFLSSIKDKSQKPKKKRYLLSDLRLVLA
jgi:ectoine hydroxylase-related dioxygenase (phytanoyl-CoA dioxygenase family)